ncbi:endonuclease domain-containing protein [Sphingomonas sp. Leaf28]|uniref:endonuclease domain-containing protein n=1 Tax=Sphingomonas sp. Leaf28 TaxID=1735695 RepID=UPI0009EAD63F|nr:endonuclease domain-containing protein [Sphingomonas sp. Leaf28]
MEQRTRIRALRATPTRAESALWQHLAARRTAGTRFNRQVPIGPFICDFVSRATKLVIEVDGGQHDWQSDDDARRTRFIENQGYRVIRFWNNDVLERLEGVVAEIARVLAERPSPNPSRKRKGDTVAAEASATLLLPSRSREGSGEGIAANTPTKATPWP